MTKRTDADSGESPPRLVYDDDCGFCTWVAAFADRHGRFELVGFADVTPDQRARLPGGWRECVHLLTDDAVYSCGEATEQIFARTNDGLDALFPVLRRLPGYPAARERLYRWGADNRDVWGKIVRRDSA